MTRSLLTLAVSVTLLSAAWVSPALAVKTQYFTQTSEADFAAGNVENVVATSSGQLRLSRKIDALLPKDRHFDAIQALTEAPDGAIVFAAFPDGDVLQLKDGKLKTLATFKDQTINSLAYDKQGRLLIGVGGEQGKLMRIDKPGDAPTSVAEPDGVKYIWSILPVGDDLFLATGPNGQIFKVDSNNDAKEYATLAGDNVLCLTTDKAGDLYAGTDTEALVYRIDQKTAKPYVLFDAAETEISALAWDSHGNLLAATSEPHDKSDAGGVDIQKLMKAAKASGGSPPMPGKPAPTPKSAEEKPGDAIPRETPLPLKHEESPATHPAESPASADKPDAGAASSDSNAVYRIDADGFATEIFRKSVIIYGMAVRGDAVILSTGDDGEVYELHPDANDENEAVLIRTDAPDATGLLTAKDGTLYVATSNAGQILKLSAGYASSGTYESDVLDATMPSLFGQMHLLGTLPEGTTLAVQTRSGNIDDPDADGWADWTDPQPAKEYLPIHSKPGRYLQYRLSFETTDATKSAVVDEISVAYQKPNVPPKIAAVTVTPSGDTPSAMTINWEAADANDDELRYDLSVRSVGHGGWMKIASDLTDTTHTWSSKDVADGHYEVQVVASDARSNPPGEGKTASRVSDAVLVDNTPPVIGDVKVVVTDGKATVTLRVIDRSGTVAAVDTSLDKVDHWQRSLPDDKMADSPEERYTVSLSGLDKGLHTLLVRAVDARGNASYETVAVTVK